MKFRIKISFALLFFAGVFTSCVEDKGNYDYNWVPDLEFRSQVANDSLIVIRGNTLTLNPVFYDVENEKAIEVNHDDYIYQWYCLPYGEYYSSDRIYVSDKYNIDEPIYLPIESNYHRMQVMAAHKETGQIYTTQFFIRVIGRFSSTYVFLTEDAAQNVEMELYGWDGSGKVVHDKDYLAISNFPYLTEGANAVTFDKFTNRLYVANGSGMSWLNSPDFDYDPVTNKLSELMIPQTEETFSKIYRLGHTGASSINREFYCFSDAGDLYVINNTGMHPAINIIGTVPVSLAPMVAGYSAQQCALFWDQTNKQVVWAGMSNQGMTSMARSLTLLSHGISTRLTDCVHMGGSNERRMIAVLKDVEGTFWRLDYNPYQASIMDNYSPRAIREPRQLVGTESLGTVSHWLTTLDKGYLYAVVNNKLYTYVESQTGVTEDPGWSGVTITDAAGASVSIEDPISFVLAETNGLYTTASGIDYSDYLNTCFYVVTYSASKGGTVYILNATDTGYNVKLIDKITGLGNVKKMSYWWG